jgi:hypothetical protein
MAPVDVTHFSHGRGQQGLNETQRVRLEELIAKRPLLPMECGELRALAQFGDRSERQRALAAVERAMPTPVPGQKPPAKKSQSGRGW